MRSDFLPFSRPSISDEDVSAVTDVLRSRWITTGARTAQFEDRFAEYVGAAGAVAVVSATAGLHLLLRAFGIGPGDEVITPSMTWVSLANLVVLAGATPVFVDVGRDDLMVDALAVERCLTRRTRLIVPVHFAGAAADRTALQRVAERSGIPTIEDAAHSVGTECRGERIGKKGTAVFSFHPIKNITTGEGGMVCSDDLDLLDRVRRLSFHGLAKDAYRRDEGRLPQAQVQEPGYKYNLTDLSAALGLSQLQRLDTWIERRRALAGMYLERLAEIPEIVPLSCPAWTTRHAWHLFVVRLDIERAGLTRDEFMARLREQNIGTGLHFLPVHSQGYFARALPSTEPLENTDWNSERICSLPLFPEMTEGDVEDVVDAIRYVLAAARKQEVKPS